MKAFKWTLAGAGGLLVAGILAVTALGSGISQAQEPGESGMRKAGAFTEALAKRLAIGVDELKAQRQAARDDVLTEAVSSGRLTQEQADKIREHPVRAGIAGAKLKVAGVAIFEAAAETLGMETAELREQLAGGKSLADVAGENGVPVETLKADILVEVEAHLDEAVANGRITQERADEALARLSERIDEIIAHEGGRRAP